MPGRPATERQLTDFGDDEKTVIGPPPSMPDFAESDVTRVGARPHDDDTRVNLHPDDDVTRVSTRRLAKPVLVPALLGDEPTRVARPPAAARVRAAATSPAEESTKRARRPRRSLVQLAFLVVAVFLVGILMMPRRRTTPTPAARPVATTKEIRPPRVHPVAPSSAAVVATSTVTASPAASSATPTSVAPVPTVVLSSSDERPAVEAVASGSYAQAARLYQALATAHPTNEAYREAARILLDRSKESPR